MKIAIVCREQLYDRIVQPLRDISSVEFSSAITEMKQFTSYVQQDVHGVILEEGIPFSDIISSMPFPHFIFNGSRDYASNVKIWIDTLTVKILKPTQHDTDSKEPIVENPADEDFFFTHPKQAHPMNREEKVPDSPSQNIPNGNPNDNDKGVSSNVFKPRPKRLYSKIMEEKQNQERTLPFDQEKKKDRVENVPKESINLPRIETKKAPDPIEFIQVKERKPVHKELELVPRSPAILPETITVCSGKGGVGVDTISLHLAGIYAKAGINVSVIDLALPYGHLSTYLNMAPSPYAEDLCEGESYYLPESELHRMTIEQSGIRYYLPPNQWPVGFGYDEKGIDKIIRNMQRLSPITICNLNHGNDWKAQLMAFSLSTKIYWILDMNKATIFHTKRQLVQLREMGFESLDKIEFIINRVMNHDLDTHMIEETLGGKIVLTLPEDKEVAVAMNQHTILSLSHKQHPFVSKLSTLVSQPKQQGSKKFARFLRG